jgi:hypothetical protein
LAKAIGKRRKTQGRSFCLFEYALKTKLGLSPVTLGVCRIVTPSISLIFFIISLRLSLSKSLAYRADHYILKL